jgi:hypothetical protein
MSEQGRGLFALGGTGAIILTIASVIMAIVGLWPLWAPQGYSFMWYLILITGLVLLLVGSVFVGIAYYAFYRHYEHPMGIASSIFGVICSVALLVFAVIGMFPTFTGYYPYYYPYYLSPFSMILYWLGLLLFGTMLVIWGATSIVIRKSTSMPGLSLATGIVLIVAGCFTASFLLSFVGFILLIDAQIMNAIVFLRMAMS